MINEGAALVRLDGFVEGSADYHVGEAVAVHVARGAHGETEIGDALIALDLPRHRAGESRPRAMEDIGPALVEGGAALSQLWLFIVAPLLGAAIAAIVWRNITVEPKGATV